MTYAITKDFSLEITAKDVEVLREEAHTIPAKTPVSVTYLPGDKLESIVAAVKTVREFGFEPMPHFSARRLKTKEDFHGFLEALTEQAGAKHCFVIAGDLAKPEGPFFDTSAVLAEGVFEKTGIQAVGLGGHPEGHPHMSDAECWAVLDKKCAEVEARGMEPLIVTQFAFDSHRMLEWLKELRLRGITAPVRLGVPGPAGIKRLLKFAAICGVGASASVMKKYGISISKLMGTAGPDKLVDEIAAGLGPEHGKVRLHFYPFGGLKKTLDWVKEYEARLTK